MSRTITWGEFKAAVEGQDVTDLTALDYIDCSFLYYKDPDDIAVGINDGKASIES